jgi:hypothetical protein
MLGMFSYSKAARERAMKIQEVVLRAMARKITWFQAAEILGFSDRHLRRIREHYEEFGYDGLFDRRRGQPSPKRVPLATVEKVLGLYREEYFDLNVRHFHEKLQICAGTTTFDLLESEQQIGTKIIGSRFEHVFGPVSLSGLRQFRRLPFTPPRFCGEVPPWIAVVKTRPLF